MVTALAAVILAALMFVPGVNIFVGVIAGFVLGGVGGAAIGLVIGLILTGAAATNGFFFEN